jgi:hypothetical protein
MQYRNIVAAADDFDFQDQAAIAKIIKEYVEQLGLSDYDQLTSFNWRIDISMRYDDDTV